MKYTKKKWKHPISKARINNKTMKTYKVNKNTKVLTSHPLLEQIPDVLNRHLVKYIPLVKKDTLAFSLKPYTHKNKTIVLGNQINGLNELIKMSSVKDKFKTMFTYDYMNYLDMDINKRKISISTSPHQFRGQPIILEGYLLIMFVNNVYNSYMLDKLKIVNIKFRSSSSDRRQKADNEYYFPDFLPDNISHSRLQSIKAVMEIINQIFTIMKYISIMIAYSGATKPYNLTNAFEIIKVQFKLFSDNSVILDNCIIKKDWYEDKNTAPTMENKLIAEWLNALVFRTVLGGKLCLDLELASISLFKQDYYQKKQPINRYLKTDNMKRTDFNNKFIIVSSEFINVINTIKYKYLINNLKKYNLSNGDLYSTQGSKPAFIWYGYDEPSGYDIIIQHYNTMAYLGNAIDSLDNINDKQMLFFLLKKLYPTEYLNFIADSFLLTPRMEYKIDSGDIFIARPITEINPETKQKKLKAASGRDIIYITDSKSMSQAKALLKRYDNVLISQYIRNPLLFKGKKFHLRIYLLITWFGSEIKTYLFDNAFILTAKLPFVLDNFDNMAIHDTHFKSTEGGPIFPKDFTTENMGTTITKQMMNKLWDDIREIMRKVSTLLVEGSSGIKKYSNLKNGFQVEGCDVMITEDLRPILIECNSKASFGNYRIKVYEEIQEIIFDFIDRNVLKPLFGNIGDQKTDEPLFVKKF